MTVTRRTVCRACLATAAAAAFAPVAGCGAGRYSGPERRITIAGGQEGGVYRGFTQQLARQVNAAEPGLHATAIATGGSVSNIDLLHSRRADIGITQADVAIAALDGTDPFASAVALTGIGRMYEDYGQLFVRADSPLRTVRDLAGRVFSIGAMGSGTAIVGERLLAAAGVRAVIRYQPLDEAVAAVESRAVDAAMWDGGLPTPALAGLHARVGIRLLPIVDALPTLRERYGVAYQQVTVPDGSYGQPRMLTIGVANLLVCAATLPDDVVAAITGVLVEHAARLVPPEALGTQFLDRRALIGLLGVPMHPGAVAAYRRLHG